MNRYLTAFVLFIGVFPKCFDWNSVTKKIVVTVKGLEPVTSCERDQDAYTVPKISLNWTQFMLQWFIRFPEFAEFTEFNESSAPFRKNFIVSAIIVNFVGLRRNHRLRLCHCKVSLQQSFQDLQFISPSQTFFPDDL